MIFYNSKAYKLLKFIKWGLVYPIFNNYVNKNYRTVNKYKKTYGGTVAEIGEFLKYKKSDTLFILGTGQSINGLTKEHFDEISTFDSIGLNGFISHEFAPNFMSFEWISLCQNQEDIEYNQTMFPLLENKINGFKNTLLILRPSPLIFPPNEENIDNSLKSIIKNFKLVYWNLFDNIPGNNLDEYKQYIHWYSKIGLIRNQTFFPNKDSSLSWTLGFALKMGYKRVVLCGIDLYGDHFYKSKSVLTESNFQQAQHNLHLTNDSKYMGVTTSELVSFWNQSMNMNIYLGTSFSLLEDKIPIYNYKFNKA